MNVSKKTNDLETEKVSKLKELEVSSKFPKSDILISTRADVDLEKPDELPELVEDIKLKDGSFLEEFNQRMVDFNKELETFGTFPERQEVTPTEDLSGPGPGDSAAQTEVPYAEEVSVSDANSKPPDKRSSKHFKTPKSQHQHQHCRRKPRIRS